MTSTNVDKSRTIPNVTEGWITPQEWQSAISPRWQLAILRLLNPRRKTITLRGRTCLILIR